MVIPKFKIKDLPLVLCHHLKSLHNRLMCECFLLFLSKLFIYLCLNVAKRNETKDKWFLEFPSTSAFVGSVF